MTGISRLSVTYLATGKKAVGPLSFSIRPGERLAVLGPSGCGKTTVLRAILGLLRPSEARLEGEISLGGAAVSAVFQRPALFPWLTVSSNVAFPLLATGRAKGEDLKKAAAPLLEMARLSEWADRLPGQLSAGMQQRVSFLRALASVPDLMLMDEPFSSLDISTKDRLMKDFLAILKARRTTLLFVTHDIGEALTMGDRILLLTGAPAAPKAEWNLEGLSESGRAGVRKELERGYEN